VADIAIYASLFLVSLGAATILPLQSEAVLTGLLLTRAYPDWLLLVVATTGNTLGSLINWYLGGSIESFRHKRWFPVNPELLERAQALYIRRGQWTLLLSWVPIIGDALTVMAGVMHLPWLRFLALVAPAKALRYIVLIWLVE
jgi:membrane protein YqaA with SNARE-associated domain